MTLLLAAGDPPPVPIDASRWSIDRFATLTLDDVRRETVLVGSRRSTLGEWFRVSGSLDDQRLAVEGECRNVFGLGTEHRGGELVIDGDVGSLVGQRMRRGTIEVRGNVGSRAGSGMRGGMLRIRGNAGDQLGGPTTGGRSGMRGGTLIVDGDAGCQAGHRLRRGMIIIHGRAEEGCGFEMIAGTLVAGHVSETNLGFAMRRGTIVTITQPNLEAPQYQERCFGAAYPAPPVFMSLLSRNILQHAPSLAPVLAIGTDGPQLRWQRSLGDLSVSGLGEILYPQLTS